MRSRYMWLAVPATFVLLAFYFYRSQSPARLVQVKRGSVREAIYGLGKIKSNQIYDLKPGITGTLLQVYVDEGDKVVAGAKLVRFDERGVVTAPFAGTVTAIPFHEKENVFPQATVLRLENLEDLFVEVALEQQGALRVRKDQPATMTLESLRGNIIKGSVETVFAREDQFIIKIKSENLPEGVLPGMSVDVVILVGERKDVLLAPLSAIANGRLTVFRNGKKQKVDVKIGVVDGDWAEVLEGDIQSDENVVISRGMN